MPGPLDGAEAPPIHSLVRTIRRFLHALGVGFVYIDPTTKVHRPIAVSGYTASMVDFLAKDFVQSDSSFKVVEHNPDRLLCWRDFPQYRDSASVRNWFHPYGADEGTSMILQTSAGARGVLHVSVASGEFPDRGLDLLEAMRPEFEMLLSQTSSAQSLTRRESQVLALIGTGATNPMIAAHLAISVNTVRRHVENILQKLKVSSRTEAALEAHRWLPL